MCMQASLLTTAALTAEVAALKQNLEWLQNDRIIMDVPGATTEVATLKQALSEAENKAAKERTEREKQEARDDLLGALRGASINEEHRTIYECGDQEGSVRHERTD